MEEQKQKVSLLNLAHFIPQKDVRKLIWWKYLDAFDRKIVWIAHTLNKKRFARDQRDIAEKCAENGYLNLLMWAVDDESFVFDEDDDGLCSAAARGGHLNILKWLRKNRYDWSFWVSWEAAVKGHLEILKWLIENGCDFIKKDLLDTQHKLIIDWVNSNIKEACG